MKWTACLLCLLHKATGKLRFINKLRLLKKNLTCSEKHFKPQPQQFPCNTTSVFF